MLKDPDFSSGSGLIPAPVSFGVQNMGILDYEPIGVNYGDWYLNSITSKIRVFDGTNWQDWSYFTAPANFAKTNASNTFTVSPQVIKINADTNRGIDVWRFSDTQSANLVTLYKQDGTTELAKFGPTGTLSIIPSSGTGIAITGAASGIGIQVNPNASGSDTARFFHINGSVLSSLNNAAQLLVRGNTSTNTTLNSAITAYTGNDGYAGLIIRGNSTTQTGDLLQVQSSGGTILSGVTAYGQTYAGSTSLAGVAIGNGTASSSGTGTVATITTNNAHGLAVGDVVSIVNILPVGYQGTYQITAVPSSTSFSYSSTATGAQIVSGTVYVLAQASVTSRTANTPTFIVKSAGAQTADLQQWQGSAGTVLSYINSSGNIFTPNAAFGTSGLLGSTHLGVTASGSTIVPVMVKGASSQSADLQQWQNSSGTVLQAVAADGTFRNYLTTNAQTGTAYTLVLADAGKNVEMNNAAANTLTVPLNSSVAYPVGTQITVIQTGAGTTTIAPASGVTVNYYSPTSAATRTIKGQWGAATLIKRATDTWVLIGNLT